MSRVGATLVVVVVAALAIAGRPIGPHAFDGGANALAFEDRTGLPLGTVLARDTEHAVRVPLERVSPHFIAAIVAAEDARFADHDGVDPFALARAGWQIARAGRIVSGGSTITMQLARLRFDLPRSPAGKLAEIVLARRIAAGTPKIRILEAYVNRVPMGGDLVGVEAGARTYFGVPSSELDLAHAAFLAALPNDPVRLSPYEHPLALEARRRAVLARMVATGAASRDDAARAAAEQIDVLPRSDGIASAPHLLFRLASQLPPGATRAHTTLDRNLQAFVENAVAQVVGALGERGAHDGAALVVDNRDGAILAYAGSADYFAHTGLGKNDGVTALRQPGSTLKPFLYELAFERRTIRPTTILADVPASYAIPGAQVYRPGDYSERFAGPVRARIALADSLNVPAVRVLSDVGVASFLGRLRALGFRHLTMDATHYGLGLALGDGEVSLEELAGAYATLANGGRRVHVHALAADDATTAEDPIALGETVARSNGRAALPRDGRSGAMTSGESAGNAASEARVGTAPEWALVTDILGDPYARARAFGVASLLRTSFPSAVKTGTSSDFRDTWTVGYTREYTVATWVGNFDGAPMQRVSGVTGAAPLWNRIIRKLAERGSPSRFAVPRGYVRRPMCATTGVRPSSSCDTVVTEWLDRDDVAAWNRPARPLGRQYDGWLAAQPVRAPGELRVVEPHDGDVFVAAPGAKIAVIARGASQPSWTLNGSPISGAARRLRWTLPLTRGRWTLAAREGARRDAVTFTVGNAPRRNRRVGFSLF